MMPKSVISVRGLSPCLPQIFNWTVWTVFHSQMQKYNLKILPQSLAKDNNYTSRHQTSDTSPTYRIFSWRNLRWRVLSAVENRGSKFDDEVEPWRIRQYSSYYYSISNHGQLSLKQFQDASLRLSTEYWVLMPLNLLELPVLYLSLASGPLLII